MKQKTTEKHFIKIVPLSFWQWKSRRVMPVWLGRWSLSMLTLAWPNKNHWKLFDGSRDFQNLLKSKSLLYQGIPNTPHIKMWGSQLKNLLTACSAQTYCQQASCVLTAEESAGWFWLLWPLLGSPPGQLCYQLHITGLHQHTYYMYQIKYVPRGNITDISFFFLFRGSVMLHCGCSELLQLVTKGRDLIVWWKMKIRYWAVSFLSANFFFLLLEVIFDILKHSQLTSKTPHGIICLTCQTA